MEDIFHKLQERKQEKETDESNNRYKNNIGKYIDFQKIKHYICRNKSTIIKL